MVDFVLYGSAAEELRSVVFFHIHEEPDYRCDL